MDVQAIVEGPTQTPWPGDWQGNDVGRAWPQVSVGGFVWFSMVKLLWQIFGVSFSDFFGG